MNTCFRWLSGIAAAAAFFTASCGIAMADTAPQPARAETYVNLFEWSFNDIARECVDFLGPNGYKAVQTSPVTEDIQGTEWWTRYQPVSYKIISRSGGREEFKHMVRECARAGVEIYVDVVFNHMAGGTQGVGIAGSTFGGLYYPAVPYDPTSFHSPACDIAQSDYNSVANGGNREHITNCDIPGLPDLNTGSPVVQQIIANYLKDLLAMGAKGFRIDAAKNIDANDIRGILNLVPGKYFVTQEVVPDGITVRSDYFEDGTINEFQFAYAMYNTFDRANGFTISQFPSILTTWGFVPGNDATVFVANHDTERSYQTTNVYFGKMHRLAHTFMLAYPYGYPQVMSDYYFNPTGTTDQATISNYPPPSTPVYSGPTAAAACDPDSDPTGKIGWDCMHRSKYIAPMVGFRKVAGDAALTNWYTGTLNQVAFGRDTRGYVAINREDSATWLHSFQTNMKPGTYCDIITGGLVRERPHHDGRGRKQDSCAGTSVIVGSTGQAILALPAMEAVAIDVESRLCHPNKDCDNDTTAPSVPQGVASSNQTSNSITLNWTASTDNAGGSGVAGYQLTRWANGVAQTPVWVAATTFIDGGLSASTSYGYSVVAVDFAGNESAPSALFTVTTSAPTGYQPSVVPLDYDPATLFAGQNLHLFYKGTLAGSANVTMHWGINSWQYVTDTPMTRRTDGFWEVYLPLTSTTTALNFVFTDGTNWDSNNGANWNLVVPPAPCTANCTAAVTFTADNVTSAGTGQSVFVVGDALALGAWNACLGAPMQPTTGQSWAATVTLPSNLAVQFKYVVRDTATCTNVTWENGNNRTLTTPNGGTLTYSGGSLQ